MFIEQSHTVFHLLRPRRSWPIVLALVCVLFPFFWLSRMWPWFGNLFNLIFSTPQAYFTGHVTLFCTAGLSTLLCLPALRRHPHYYTLCLMASAFAEEFIQILFNSHPGLHKDMRNLLLDLGGVLLAHLVWHIWQRRHPAGMYLAKDPL